MRKLGLLGLLLLLIGCQNTVGPLAPRPPQRADDPAYSISEQERRGRDRLALPDQARNSFLPNTSTAPPDTWKP